MLRALYGQFKRFLVWLNGGGYRSRMLRTTAETSRVATAAAPTWAAAATWAFSYFVEGDRQKPSECLK